MKKILIAMLVVLCMIFGLVACGGDTSDVPVKDVGTTQTDAPSADTVETPSDEMSVDSYHSAEILSCEVIKDSDGNDAIAVHIQWTNGSDESKSFYVASVGATMYQDGVELEWAYPDYDLENILTLQENQDLNLRPGASIEVVCCAKLRNTTSTVEIEIHDTSWDIVTESVLIAAGEYNFD